MEEIVYDIFKQELIKLPNFPLLDEDKVKFQVYAAINYHNFRFDDEPYNIRNSRCIIFKSGGSNLSLLKYCHILHKHKEILGSIHPSIVEAAIKKLTKEEISPTISPIKPTSLSNDKGLDIFEVSFLLQRHEKALEICLDNNICYIANDWEKTCKSLIDNMNKITNNPHKKEISMFKFSVDGEGGRHCNLFLFDFKDKTWYRIEPNGGYFYEDKNPLWIDYQRQYHGIDEYIKTHNLKYFSPSDYHFLPGMHKINPGPYCAYYVTMIVESYLKFRNIFEAIEKASDIKYITRKLHEYDIILTKYRRQPTPHNPCVIPSI